MGSIQLYSFSTAPISCGQQKRPQKNHSIKGNPIKNQRHCQCEKFMLSSVEAKMNNKHKGEIINHPVLREARIIQNMEETYLLWINGFSVIS